MKEVFLIRRTLSVPEVRGQGYEDLIAGVIKTVEPFYANELSAPLMQKGELEQRSISTLSIKRDKRQIVPSLE